MKTKLNPFKSYMLFQGKFGPKNGLKLPSKCLTSTSAKVKMQNSENQIQKDGGECSNHNHQISISANEELIPLAISFSGCGFLSSYHFGVAQCLQNHAQSILTKSKYFSGASAGALVAALLVLCPNSIRDGMEELLLLASEINQKPLGVLTPGFNLSQRLAAVVERFIPDDIGVAQNRLIISLTRQRDFTNVRISQFQNRYHLLECLRASCFIPIYSSGFLKTPEIDGEGLIDGAYTDNLPIPPGVPSVTVSPFSGSALIAPEDTGSLFEWKMTLGNQLLNVNMQNVVRGAQALFPPKEEVLRGYYDLGYRNAMKFLLQRNWLEREPGSEV